MPVNIPKLSKEDVDRIQQLLAPLQKDPSKYETLNEMAKVRRRIVGEEDPDLSSDVEEVSVPENKDLPAYEEPPEFKTMEDTDSSIGDDVIDQLSSGDLDDILNSDYFKKPEESPTTTEEDPLSLDPTSLEDNSEPVIDDSIPSDLGLEDIQPTTEEDPFGSDWDTTAEDTKPPTTEEDPFGSDWDTTAEDTKPPTTEEDPFGSDWDTTVEDTKPPTTEEDPFGSDWDTTVEDTKPPTTEENPFGSDWDIDHTTEEEPFGSNKDSSAQEENPFDSDWDIDTGTTDEDPLTSDIGSDSFKEDTDSFGESDFPQIGELPTDADISMDSDPFPKEGSSKAIPDDEFLADLGADLGETEEDSKIGVSDRFNTDSLGNLDVDTDSPENFAEEPDDIDKDLSSLAEGEPISEDDLSDQDLAVIQQEIINYPPKLKRTIIDAIGNDRIPNRDQRALLELIKSRQKPEDIADYLGSVLGQKVDLYDSSGLYSQDGVKIISTKEVYTKEGEFRRRQLIKRTALGIAAGFLLLVGLFSSYKYVIRPYQAASQYELGLDEIKKAWRESKESNRRKEHLKEAENFFAKGEKIEPNNLEFLNKYGIAYMKIGEYDKAFRKLWGEVSPDLSAQNNEEAWNTREHVPLVQFANHHSWDDDKLPLNGKPIDDIKDKMKILVDRSKLERDVLHAGAYLVSVLNKKKYDINTLINLGRFHSNPGNAGSKESLKYKNDSLAINYYKMVFTDGNEPHNISATAGLGKIYYNKKDYAKSAYYYNKIVDKYPKEPIGHEGLLSNYIEMWKNDRNPQFVLNHHRHVVNILNIEEKLSLYALSKLASFYIDLNPSEVRIKYNVNPEDQVSGMDVDDVAARLLTVAFDKKEKIDGEVVAGKNHAESYYQRGRFFIRRGEGIRALKQFEHSANYDPAHYLSVLEMAEHYMRIGNESQSLELLRNAVQRYERYKDEYGHREEDETLVNGDIGRVYFDIGKLTFYDSAKLSTADSLIAFPARKIYPDRALGKFTEDESNRRKSLVLAQKYFNKALDYKLKNQDILKELHYYKGWIEYIKAESNENFVSSLKEWSFLEEENFTNINLLMGRANSFYYTGQLNAALGNYLRVKEDYEEKISDIHYPVAEDMRHQELFQTLVATYNNIGAVYERKGDSAEAMKYYWKAIETARLISSVSEAAMTNKDMLFKKKSGDGLPMIEDWLPPTLDSVADIQNKKRKVNY